MKGNSSEISCYVGPYEDLDSKIQKVFIFKKYMVGIFYRWLNIFIQQPSHSSFPPERTY